MKKRIAAVCAASAIAVAGLAGPAVAAGPPPPPNCESGQLRAAANALKKGKVDKAAKHAAKAAACAAGQNPGQGGS